MNVSASVCPLIIGIGNPLRGDDGLGWAVAERLRTSNTATYDIRTVHQLTPELAWDIQQADLVVLIDACCEGEPGTIAVHLASHISQPGAVGTHYTTPEELAALTITLYGSCPPILVITISGKDFSLREQLSPVIAAKIPTLSKVVARLCSGGTYLR